MAGFPVYNTQPIAAEDASGSVPSLTRQAEQAYRAVLTTNNTSFTFDMLGFNAFYIQLNNFGGGPGTKVQVSVSNDNKIFIPQAVEFIGAAANGSTTSFKTLPLTFGMSNYGPLW